MKSKPDGLIYQLKVTLQGTKPPIWRRILVPDTITLPKLHQVLQVAMGWTDSHLHSFAQGDEIYGEPFEGMDYMRSESRVKLNSLLQQEKDTITYEYDFGDSWEHKIVLEKILPPDPSMKLPVCTAGKLACPPEDCGGTWGYYNLLDVLADPAHPEHEDMKEWIGGDIDPESFDLAGTNAMLAKL
jgi:hypothetical protein